MILTATFCFLAFMICMILGIMSAFNRISGVVIDKYFEKTTETTFSFNLTDLLRKKKPLGYDKVLTFKKLDVR